MMGGTTGSWYVSNVIFFPSNTLKINGFAMNQENPRTSSPLIYYFLYYLLVTVLAHVTFLAVITHISIFIRLASRTEATIIKHTIIEEFLVQCRKIENDFEREAFQIFQAGWAVAQIITVKCKLMLLV